MMEDKRLFYNQPGVVIKMKAKEGRGQELFDLCLKAKHLEELGIDDPTDWVLCRSDEDNDVLLAFEFFRSDEAKDNHYSKPSTEDETNEIMELLADIPQRIDTHIVYSSETEK
ncbi:hypothetical protein ABH527_010550 [Staphylococcus warneri]